MVDLYIDNKKVDLDDSVDIKLNKKLEDIINPTVIKTAFSRSINIPKTANNNKIFSHYYRFDKMLGLSDFNANQRVPYVLFDTSEVLMSGYLKLNKISTNYEITLFDETASLLRSMSTKTVLDALPNLTHNINRGTIISSWDFNPVSFEDTGSVYDYITYVPAFKGTYDDFSNSKVEETAGTITDIGYDVDEFDRQELRSYYQCPAIYYNKLIQCICSDNNIRLHQDFHNQLNPYWTNTVLMFPKLISSNDSVNTSTATLGQSGIINYYVNDIGVITLRFIGSQKFAEILDPYNIFNATNPTKMNLTGYASKQVKVNYTFTIRLKFNGNSTYHASKQILPVMFSDPNSSNILKIKSYFEGQLNDPNIIEYAPTIDYTNKVLRNGLLATTDASGDGYFRPVSYYNGVSGDIQTSGRDIIIKGTAILPTNITTQLKFDIDIFPNAITSTPGVIGASDFNTSLNPIISPLNIMSEVVYAEYSTCEVLPNDVVRSNAYVDKNNIIPNTLLQSDILLNHIKQFGLVLDKDKDGYIIKPRNTFYREGNIVNWSSKIDYNTGVEIEPIPYDKKYQMLQYEPNTTTHYKNYSSISKIPFADFKIDTSYEFNEEEDELYKSKFNCPLISQEYVLDRNNSKWKRLDYIAPAMHTIDNEKKSKAEAPMTLLFKYPSKYLNEYHNEYPSKLTLMYVSDDSTNMKTENEFMWVNNTAFKTPYVESGVSKFPTFDSISDDFLYSLEFGKNFIYYNNRITELSYSEDATIYNRLFKK